MFGHNHLTTLHHEGHQYDPRVLAIDLELLSLLHKQVTDPRMKRAGMVGLMVADEIIQPIRRDRRLGVHRVAHARPEGTACTCGLVMPTGLDVLDTTGHREPVELEIVREGTLVVGHEARDASGFLEMRYGVRCLDCEGSILAADQPDAHALAEAHSCGDPVVDRAVLRLHLGLTPGEFSR